MNNFDFLIFVFLIVGLFFLGILSSSIADEKTQPTPTKNNLLVKKQVNCLDLLSKPFRNVVNENQRRHNRKPTYQELCEARISSTLACTILGDLQFSTVVVLHNTQYPHISLEETCSKLLDSPMGAIAK